MSTFHDCGRANCSVKPDGSPWGVKPDPKISAVVWDNESAKLVARSAVAGRKPVDDVPEA